MDKVPLIPRTVLFGNPDKMNVRLSTDGKYLSFIAPYEGVLNVWVGPREDWRQAQPVTFDKKRGIRNYFWPHQSDCLLYLQDQEGNENWHLYRVDLKTQEVTDLTPFEQVHARVEQVSEKFPESILVGLNHRRPEFHDLYLLNLLTGELEKIEENNEFAGFLCDWDLNPRLAMRMQADGGGELLKKEDGQWQPFQSIPMEDLITTNPLSFDASNQVLYFQDSRGRNTSALISLDLRTEEVTLLAVDEKADMSDALFHPQTKQVEAFASTYERKHWKILDSKLEKDFDALKALQSGEMEIIDRTDKDDFWIVAYLYDNAPVQYYLYDRNTQRAEYLFSQNSDLENQSLVSMRPVLIPTRDGKTLVSYLTMPEGTGDKPVPMVLIVHGGPTVRDTWGYNAQHQWLANRGYAVLSPNYRGSTGVGKDFIVGGYGEWAGKAHDDLVDSVQWAIEEGIADPDKVAIMGGSYGGYATLVGLSMTPEVFACGVDIVGPSNLQTLLESVPEYWKPMLDMLKVRIGGDHETEEGREFLKTQSPLTYADQICKPLLIGQGANDPRVKQSESDQIVSSLQNKGIPVTYVLYPDEGHGFARPENRLSFYAVAEGFLSRVLGGSCEPIGDDFEGSSIEIIEDDGTFSKASKSAESRG